MPNTSPHLRAGGDIRPCRFVMLSSSADRTGLQATANAPIIGVSQEGGSYPPLNDLVSDHYAARTGQYFRLFGDGDYALVEAGEAFGRGTRLKADADGKAVAIATTGTDRQNIGAVALESAGAAGELVPVQVLSMRDTRPALT
ncbi:MAG: hypothetical protein RBS80_28900 [Thermoguttaceae bacterium]|nr:hypothetical protein [Thermoguttaceae bacterium]